MDTLSSRFGSDPFVVSLRKALPHMIMGNIRVVPKRVEDTYWDSISTAAAPIAFSLAQNYPNPFNPSTTIGFTLPWSAKVRIEIFDMLGRRLEVATEKEFNTGSHTVIWQSRSMPSGIYFYRLFANPNDGSKDKSASGKMMVVK